MAKFKKTNAIRMLEQQKLSFNLLEYDVEDGFIDGLSVAKKTDQDPRIVFKTLVAQTSDKQIVVFLLPLTKELNLKRAAQIIQTKKLELLPVSQLEEVTGYVRGGCSPIGMKKAYPIFLDETAYSLDEIIISAGKPGLQIKLSRNDFVRLTKAKQLIL